MVKLKLLLEILIFGYYISVVLSKDTVGIKENIKDLDDDDVLVISVAHSKKDRGNATIEKLISITPTLSTTEAESVVDSSPSNVSTTSLPTTSMPHDPVMVEKVERKHGESCPTLDNVNSLTDEEFFDRLVHPCRYDRIQRPRVMGHNGRILPVLVHSRAYVYYLENLDTHNLEYKMQILLQLRYNDPRLRFELIAPHRVNPIKGEANLREKLWVPHIFFQNEKHSSVLGTYGRHIVTAILPDGTIIISSRIEASLFCPMDLRKFPFDIQTCHTTLECWMYNTSQVELHWEEHSPITLSTDKILTEYSLAKVTHNETVIVSDEINLRHGSFIGNYSSISFSFTLEREAGFYVLEYYLPSVVIVAISWVGFYLQADQTAPRAMLGATSMLSFITLSSAQYKILPKVSYIKVSEVWSMGCTFFIFGSLVEFAFVNVIWRRRKHVELKKVNARNILKHTLTAREIRKILGFDSSRSVHQGENNDNKICKDTQQTIEEILNQRNKSRKPSNFSLDLSEVNEQSDDEISNNSFNQRKIKFNGKRLSLGTITIDSKLKSIDEAPGNKKVKFSAYDDSDSNDERKDNEDSQYESQSSNETPKLNSIRHRKISPAIRQSLDRKDVIETISQHVSDDQARTRKISMGAPPAGLLNRRDSTMQIFTDPESGKKTFMLPILLTENDKGEFSIDSNPIMTDDNTVSVVIEPDKDCDGGIEMSYSSDEEETPKHKTIADIIRRQSMAAVDGWTRMTPHEISHWIDKRSRVFFPGAFLVFNMFYWSFIKFI